MQIWSPQHVCQMDDWLSFFPRPARGFQVEWICHLLVLRHPLRHSSQIRFRPLRRVLRINKLWFNRRRRRRRRQTRSVMSGALGSKVYKYVANIICQYWILVFVCPLSYIFSILKLCCTYKWWLHPLKCVWSGLNAAISNSQVSRFRSRKVSNFFKFVGAFLEIGTEFAK